MTSNTHYYIPAGSPFPWKFGTSHYFLPADQSVKHAHIKGHQTFRKAQNPFLDFSTETQNLLLDQ